MKIIIIIKDKKIRLILLDGGKERDFLDIADEYQLSEDLLPKIDKLLKKNNLKPESIEKMEVESDQDDNFTTTRIARSVANAWNFARFDKK